MGLVRIGTVKAARYATVSNPATSAMLEGVSPSNRSAMLALALGQNGERVLHRQPVIDNKPRQQQPPGIAAHGMDFGCLPTRR